jgi:hypothetical protein
MAGGRTRHLVTGVRLVLVVAILHASCAPVTKPDGIPFPPSGEAIPLLPPALQLPPWWPKDVPPPKTEPLWMTYPPAWREA